MRSGRSRHFVYNAGIPGTAGRLESAGLRDDARGDRGQRARRAVVDAARHPPHVEEARRAGGSIVLLSSVAADIGGPNEYVWYAASKGAIESMTYGLEQGARRRRHPGQLRVARRERDPHPRRRRHAGEARQGRADDPDGPRRASRRRAPRRCCFCSRMRRPTSAARCCASPAGGSTVRPRRPACAVPIRPYDRARRSARSCSTRQNGSESWLQQSGCIRHGGPEVLTYEQIEIGAPGPGQVKLKQHAVGRELHRHLFPHGHVSVAGRPAVRVRQRGRGRGDRGRPRRDRSQGRRPRRLCGGAGRLCRGAADAGRSRGEDAGQHQLRAGRRA